MHPATPHDKLLQLYPGVHFLHGSIRMRPGVCINRNMMVLEHEGSLTLINPVRMNEAGLARLDALGKVTALVRLGDFHGLDDAFYLHRYQCDLRAQHGSRIKKRVAPTHFIEAGAPGPVPNSEYFVFPSATFPEAALLLREHHLLITTDSLQYYDKPLRHFSLPAKLAFRFLGFRRGLNIGPMWLKGVTPEGGSLKADFEQLLALDFDAVVGAHGVPMASGAKAALRAQVTRIFGPSPAR